MLRRSAFATLSALLALAACQEAKAPSQASPALATSGTGPLIAAANAAPARQNVDESAIDPGVRPCDDFYLHACGGWKKATPVPADEAAWYRSFNGIAERNELTMKRLLEAFAKGENKDQPYAKALGDFYAACMDEAAVEKAGDAALAPELAKVAALTGAAALPATLGRLTKNGTEVPFALESGPDFKDATLVIGQMAQAGLGLPDRDYYLSTDAKKKELRSKYEEHVEHMLALAGEKDAKKAARTVMRMEMELARASMSREDRRDPKKVYHRMELADLQKLAPELAWKTFLDEAGVPADKPINVGQPEFVKAVGKLAKSAPPADWRTYLTWHVVRKNARRMPAKVVEESFRFRSLLTGVAKLPPRWKRCVRETDGALGEALGQAFVKETLGAEGKKNVLAMIHSIEEQMKANLARLPWMDDATRAKANEKLAAISNMIAYPEKWRSYDGLQVDRGSYLANATRADAFELARQLQKVGKPVDRSEWQMTPPTVNAYYDPTYNQMVFPAGILQPPYYSNERTAAANLGGVGMVMGHELTHGFDDQGRQFDAKGNLEDWWTPKVNDEFLKRATCVEKQYAAYAVPSGERVNGKLTLGENIADLGGVKVAFAAVKGGKEPGEKYSAEQQFFYGFAQGWCANERDEFLRLMVSTNPHSPAQFRVNGPVSNLPEFAKAFACKEGDRMVRPAADRCEVW